MSETFEPIKYYEPLESNIIRIIYGLLGPIALTLPGEIDSSKGSGVIKKGIKCVWLDTGYRITIIKNNDTYLAFCSEEIDPLNDPNNRPVKETD